MADMGAGHEQAVRADAGYAGPLRRAAVEAAMLADDVVRTDLQPYRFTLVAVVLRVAVTKQRGDIFKFRGETFIDDKLAAEADFAAMVVTVEQPAS